MFSDYRIAGLIFALLYWNDEQSYDVESERTAYQVLIQLSICLFGLNVLCFFKTCISQRTQMLKVYCMLTVGIRRIKSSTMERK
jgi:hypothetical protein